MLGVERLGFGDFGLIEVWEGFARASDWEGLVRASDWKGWCRFNARFWIRGSLTVDRLSRILLGSDCRDETKDILIT